MTAAIHPMMIPMLKRWETCMLTPYRDKGKARPWHIGYGHGNENNYPPFVDENTVLRDEAHAMEILVGELTEIYVPQLSNLFRKIDFKPPNDLFFSGFLDALYNRGAGRIAGADAGSKEHKGSYAWHILKTMQGEKHWTVKAANALSHSHVEDFTALDVAYDDVLKADHVFDGLTARRACDTALCLWEKF